MQTDKELALKVVDALEDYYLRNTLLETMLDAYKVPGCRQQFDEVFPLQSAKESAHEKFWTFRQRILDAPDLTTAMREMLKDVEP